MAKIKDVFDIRKNVGIWLKSIDTGILLFPIEERFKNATNGATYEVKTRKRPCEGCSSGNTSTARPPPAIVISSDESSPSHSPQPLLCKICLDPAIEPVRATCCGTLLGCKQCIVTWKRRSGGGPCIIFKSQKLYYTDL